MMNFPDYRTKLIEIAERFAAKGAKDDVDFLHRFRTIYRHLITTVDGTANDLGMNPFGPMPMEFQSPRPDFAKLLQDTDTDIDSLR